MINWKTTLPGLVTAVINIAVLFGLEIDTETKVKLVLSITTIGLFLTSLFAKDSNVTGGTKKNRN